MKPKANLIRLGSVSKETRGGCGPYIESLTFRYGTQCGPVMIASA